MPSVVLLKHSREVIIVRSAWFQGSGRADVINAGIQPGKEVRIFFSPDRTEKPNFELQTLLVFNGDIAGCYDGYVLDHFGMENLSKLSVFSQLIFLFFFFSDQYQKAEECAAKKRRLRRTVPVDYSESKTARILIMDEENGTTRARQSNNVECEREHEIVGREMNTNKCPKRSRPRSEIAKLKEKISMKIKQMSVLKNMLFIQNRVKDKISVDDLDEIEDLLDDSDAEDDDDDDENGQILMVEETDAEMLHANAQSAPAMHNLNVDKNFSLNHQYIIDVCLSHILWFERSFHSF